MMVALSKTLFNDFQVVQVTSYVGKKTILG